MIRKLFFVVAVIILVSVSGSFAEEIVEGPLVSSEPFFRSAEVGNRAWIVGAITSQTPVSRFEVVVNGRMYRPAMLVGRLGESNLNGKWIVRGCFGKNENVEVYASVRDRKGHRIAERWRLSKKYE